MNKIDRLKEIQKKADEITLHCINQEYDNDPQKLKKALDQLSRAIAMFVDIEIHKLKGGKALSHDPIKYIELNLLHAHQHIIHPVINNKSQSI